MCLLQGTGSHVSDVAHGPLVFFLLRLFGVLLVVYVSISR